jgi:DNA-directed RNA polymerase subunit RPC12/RpoP
MTQRCFKCGRRIEPFNDEGTSSGSMIILIEFWLTDPHMNKQKQIGRRYYCQDCGVLVNTILENWEGQ